MHLARRRAIRNLSYSCEGTRYVYRAVQSRVANVIVQAFDAIDRRAVQHAAKDRTILTIDETMAGVLQWTQNAILYPPILKDDTS